MEIKDLFQYATIAELSPHIKQNLRIADQGEVKGKVSLTPIQHWFFDHITTDQHYYNQAVIVACAGRFSGNAASSNPAKAC